MSGPREPFDQPPGEPPPATPPSPPPAWGAPAGAAPSPPAWGPPVGPPGWSAAPPTPPPGWAEARGGWTAVQPPAGYDPITGAPVAWRPVWAPPQPRPSRLGAASRVVGIVLAVLVVAGAFIGGIEVGRSTSGDAGANVPPDAKAELPLLYQAWNLVEQHYVDRSALDQTQLTYGAIRGMLEALGDTGHTDFLTPQEAANLSSSLAGTYVGIGVVLSIRQDGPAIARVFEGSPAQQAGLRDGDLIVAVDGHDVTTASLDTLQTLIRGPEGTSVTLTIQRSGDAAARSIPVKRAKVDIPNVSWTAVPGHPDVAFVRLEEFASGSGKELIDALKAARAAGATAVVFDLRGNPGGYVNEAVTVASQFLSGGDVYLQRDADGKETEAKVETGGIATSMPLVVLVDENSASAAEIVGGAIQDAGRAKIVGATTFGTGTVLGQYKLDDGSEVRIGVAEWLTPHGHQIWHNGIKPDVPVALDAGATELTPDDVRSMSAADLAGSKDAQLLKALELLSSK